jgi:hypothetical protein
MMRFLSQTAAVGSFGVGLVALNVGVGGLNCAPTVYGKFELSGHPRDLVHDPKFSLKFGNAAFSAMFIHDLHYEVIFLFNLILQTSPDICVQVDGQRVSSLRSVFDPIKGVQLCTESIDLMGRSFSSQPRAWKHGGLVALAVVRPVEPSRAWSDCVVRALKEHQVTVVVTTSVAPSGMACWLTKKTSRLPVAN